MEGKFKGTILTGQFFKLADYERKLKSSTASQRLGVHLIPVSIATRIPEGFENRVKTTAPQLIPDKQWVRWYHTYKTASAQVREDILKAYERRYKAYLYHNFSADEIYAELMDGHGKYDLPILLCWERDDYPCHRHWAADFFKYYGYDCFEFQL